MISIEGEKSIFLAAPAFLIEETREHAWAEPHVIKNPAYAWVLGKYVGAGQPNLNGHIFAIEDLKAMKSSLVHAPMNLLHRPHHITGTFVANELVYPTGTGEAAAQGDGFPYMEALAAFWKYYYPDEFALVEKAHAEGSLAWSMECVPESLTCAAVGGCGDTFAYAGRTSPTYCAHLNQHAAHKTMNKPHFTAGALVVPPARPAWRSANVTELSSVVQKQLETMAATTFEEVAGEFPHLNPLQWESIMGELVTAAKAPASSHRTCKSCGAHMATDATKCPSCGAAWQASAVIPASELDLSLAAARGRDLAAAVRRT